MESLNNKYKRTSKAQLQCFVEFLKDHREMLTGKNSPTNPNCQEKLWKELAAKLNALYGPNKSEAKWKETLSNWKKQLRARARKAKAEREKTGGGPFMGEELSEFEQHALSVFGMSAVNGIGRNSLGLRVSTSSASQSPSNSIPPSPQSPNPPSADAYLYQFLSSPGATSPDAPTAVVTSVDECNTTNSSQLPTENCPTANISVPLAENMKNITKQQLYNIMVQDMKQQQAKEERMTKALESIGVGMQSIADVMAKLADKL